MAGPSVLIEHVQDALFKNDIASLRRYLNHPRFPDFQTSGGSLGESLWSSVISNFRFPNQQRTESLSVQGLDLLHQKVPFKSTFLGTFPFVTYLTQASSEHLKWFQTHYDVDSWGQLRQMILTFGVASIHSSFDENHFEWFKSVFDQYEKVCGVGSHHFQQIKHDLLEHYFFYANSDNDTNPFSERTELPFPKTYLYALEKTQLDLKFPWDDFLYLSPLMTGKAVVQLAKKGILDLDTLSWDELQASSERSKQDWMTARTVVEQHLLEQMMPKRDEKIKMTRL